MRDRPASGVLSVYFFHHEHAFETGTASECFTDQTLVRLADYAGNAISEFRKVRCDAAIAAIAETIATSGPGVLTLLEELKIQLVRIFSADGCSLFSTRNIREQGTVKRRLRCLATTGLVSNPDVARKPEGEFVEYDVNRNVSSEKGWTGLTAFLAFHPNQTLRKNDIYSQQEIVEGVAIDIAPEVLMPERLVPAELGHHRFLGSSLTPDCTTDEIPAEDAPGYLIRLVRKSSSAPFSYDDEQLLRIIGPQIQPVFAAELRQRQDLDGAANCKLAKRIKSSLRMQSESERSMAETIAACHRLMTNRSACSAWNRSHLESVMQDVLLTLKPVGAVRVSVRLVQREPGHRKSLDLFAFRSTRSVQPPSERQAWPRAEERPHIGWTSLREEMAVVYQRGSTRREDWLADHDQICWGVNVPFRLFVAGHCVRGVFACDFDSDLEKAEDTIQSALDVCSVAARKLGDMTGYGDATRVHVSTSSDTSGLKQLESTLTLECTWWQFRLKADDGSGTLSDESQFFEKNSDYHEIPDQRMQLVTQLPPKQLRHELEEYGGQISASRVFQFPLYLNCEQVGTISGCLRENEESQYAGGSETAKMNSNENLANFEPVDFLKNRQPMPTWLIEAMRRLSRVSAAWHAFANSTVGLRHEWRQTWEVEKFEDSMTIWKCRSFWMEFMPDSHRPPVPHGNKSETTSSEIPRHVDVQPHD